MNYYLYAICQSVQSKRQILQFCSLKVKQKLLTQAIPVLHQKAQKQWSGPDH